MSTETCEGMWINEIQYFALSENMPHLNTSISKDYYVWIAFHFWYVIQNQICLIITYIPFELKLSFSYITIIILSKNCKE